MELIKALTVFFVVLVLPFGIWIQCFTESEFIFNPLIDTKLPPGFTNQQFDSIKPGITKAEVLKIVPPPMYSSTDETSWSYGDDGAASFGDFAWFRFIIHFDTAGKVKTTERLKFHD